jgi:hypothetical protein
MSRTIKGKKPHDRAGLRRPVRGRGQAPAQRCRVCGCTENRACPGGCFWVEDDLCSACAEGFGR